MRLCSSVVRIPWVILLATVMTGSIAGAHPPPKTVTRELVRLRGARRPDGDAPAGRMTLRAQGTEHPFAAVERQAFALLENEAEEPPKVADRYTLQGPRELLNQFTTARPNQTITILAEHRPGSTDLFLLTLDLCPPR
jgi:hypothetical protein